MRKDFEVTKKSSRNGIEFFRALGCSDFELELFKNFYFSRTRKSLEHYYPQAKAGDNMLINLQDINCFGNFATVLAPTGIPLIKRIAILIQSQTK